MNDKGPESVALNERVICVVAKDILSLERRDIGLDDLVAPVWRDRWLVLAFIVAFGLMGVLYSFLARKWYVAEIVVIPVSQSNMGNMAGQLGNLGLLTNLAGINLQEGSNTDEALGVLGSRDFARQFIEQQNLVHVLLWSEWNAKTGQWKETDPRRQPDIRDAIRYFDRNVLSVLQDRKTSLVTVSIRWKDPVKAAAWANTIVAQLNAQMRARALAQGEQNIGFLEQETATTTQMNVRVAIAQLIEKELQKLMVARSNKEFAFQVIDHAEVPKYRAWPKLGIVAVLGVLAGGLGGLLAVFIGELRKRRVHRPVVNEAPS